MAPGLRLEPYTTISVLLDPSPSFTRSILRLRLQRGLLIDQAQRLSDGSVKLRIETLHVVLRRNIHFDVGISAVVLDVPADILEPEGVFGLRGARAINQRVAG